MAISISKSQIDQFHVIYRDDNGKTPKYRGMRMGQAFHTHFRLDKITNEEDKIFCDRLYEMGGDEAKKLIHLITDYFQ